MTRASACILSLTFAVLAGIVWAWWPDLAMALALEQSPLAWLQSTLLIACACAAGMRAMAGTGQTRWCTLALLLVLAALDERFMLHEQLQEFIVYRWFDGAPQGGRWAAALTLLYGAVGLMAIAWLRASVSRPAWRWVLAALSVGLSAIGFDVAFDSVTMQVYEEVLEVSAEALLLCGLFREAGRPACPRCSA